MTKELLIELSNFTCFVLPEISIHFLDFLLATLKPKQAIDRRFAKVLSNCHIFLRGSHLRFLLSLRPRERSFS